MQARVIRVVDGDTIEVVIGEQNERVRYIGVNSPRESGEQYGQEAANRNAGMALDRVVWLAKDVSERDGFGRLLRYVIAEDFFVNYEMVRQGYSTGTSYPPDTACDLAFQNAQLEARLGNLGMWAVAQLSRLCRRRRTVPVRAPTIPPVTGVYATAAGRIWTARISGHTCGHRLVLSTAGRWGSGMCLFWMGRGMGWRVRVCRDI